MANFGIRTRANQIASVGAVSIQPVPLQQIQAMSTVITATAATVNPTTVSQTVFEQAQATLLPIIMPTETVEQIRQQQNVPATVSEQFVNVNTSVANINPTIVSIAQATSVQNIDTTISRPISIAPCFVGLQARPVVPRPLTSDSVRLSEFKIINGQFKASSVSGISSFRPEILAAVDYNTFFKDGLDRSELTPSGKLVELNYQVSQMKLASMQSFFDVISDLPGGPSLFEQNTRLFQENMVAVGRQLDFIKKNFQQINQIKRSFDPRLIPRSNYNPYLLSLQEFLIRKCLFTDSNIQSFSDTKLFYQLILDFRNILQKWSLSLLDTSDSDRGGDDSSPISLDRTYGDSLSFGFSPAFCLTKLGFVQADFDSFQSSLPSSNDDKIKVLLTTISKELRVSRGLSNATTRNQLASFYQANLVDGTPFDNILGDISGNDIFSSPIGPNSLCSLFALTPQTNFIVLPFERKLVDDGQTTFVPGNVYFTDTILEQTPNNTFNLQPLSSYVETYSSVVDAAKRSINELLLLTPEGISSPLVGANITSTFLRGLKESMKIPQEEQGSYVNDQLIITALFKLAQKDKTLKFMLYQFVLLAGMASSNPSNEKKIFTRLADEVVALQNLPSIYVGLTETPSLKKGILDLGDYVVRFAEAIQAKVIELLTNGNTIVPLITGNTTSFFIADNIQNAVLQSNTPRKTISLQEDSVKSALIKVISPSTSYPSTLLKEIIDLSVEFDQAATINGNEKAYVLGGDAQSPSSSTLTRYNQISTSFLVLYIFEILSSFSNRCYSVDLSVKNNTQFNVVFSELELSAINSVLEDMLSDERPVLDVSVQARLRVQPVQQAPTVLSMGILNEASSPTQTTTVGSVVGLETRSDNNAGNASTLAANRTSGLINASGIAPSLTPTDIQAVFPRSVIDVQSAMLVNNLFYQKFVEVKKSLEAIKFKVSDEDTTVSNIIHIFNVVGDNIGSTKSQAISYFSNANVIQERLQFSELPDQEQAMLSAKLYDFYTRSTKNSNNKQVTQDEFAAVVSLCSSPKINVSFASSRMKFFVVGIPKGFSSKLQERTTRQTIGSSFQDQKQTDVVKIKFWKRSAEDDDIIFKPQTFTFDLSLFPQANNEGLLVSPYETFEAIYKRFSMIDYSRFGLSETTTNNKVLNYQKFIEDSDWSFIPGEQKEQLFRNHVTSYLLEKYVQLSTGFTFNEESFPVKGYDKTMTSNQNVVRQMIQGYYNSLSNDKKPTTIPQSSIDELLQQGFMNNQAQVFLTDISLLRLSDEINMDLVVQKILNQKKFERVFIVPVCIDDFVVDQNLTKQTSFGSRRLSQAETATNFNTKRNGEEELLVQNRKTQPAPFIFDEIFVNIETFSSDSETL